MHANVTSPPTSPPLTNRVARQNRIGEMQHAWLVAVCGKLGLTRCILPQPIIARYKPKRPTGARDADARGAGWLDRARAALQDWWDGGEGHRDEEVLAAHLVPFGVSVSLSGVVCCGHHSPSRHAGVLILALLTRDGGSWVIRDARIETAVELCLRPGRRGSQDEGTASQGGFGARKAHEERWWVSRSVVVQRVVEGLSPRRACRRDSGLGGLGPLARQALMWHPSWTESHGTVENWHSRA